MRLNSLLMLLLTLILTTWCPAQISVTPESLSPVGTSWTTYMVNNTVEFDVGSAGAGQTWTFGEYEFGNSATGAIADPAGTPWGDQFPQANWAWVSEGNQGATYYRIASDALYWLGTANNAGVNVFTEEAYVMPFPCTYSTQWAFVTNIEMEIAPGVVMSMHDSVANDVDGWGTCQTQFGSYDVLRVFGHTYSYTYMNGEPINESEFVGYIWYTAGGQDVVSVTADDGVVDPNFSSGFLEMSDMSVPASPRGPVAGEFAIGQNYPNPFNPTTTLPLELDKSARVTLKIYDATGRLVSSEEQMLPAGHHNMQVDGSRWASGTYFARVNAGVEQKTLKMQLVK